mmetsp:Transcript_112773/g.318812  ORF Transcript_112773/g.318812 Transcript_112773/m.318812 type:complete len:211 (+) Transcript_112773:738-1370(+)
MIGGPTTAKAVVPTASRDLNSCGGPGAASAELLRVSRHLEELELRAMAPKGVRFARPRERCPVLPNADPCEARSETRHVKRSCRRMVSENTGMGAAAELSGRGTRTTCAGRGGGSSLLTHNSSRPGCVTSPRRCKHSSQQAWFFSSKDSPNSHQLSGGRDVPLAKPNRRETSATRESKPTVMGNMQKRATPPHFTRKLNIPRLCAMRSSD